MVGKKLCIILIYFEEKINLSLYVVLIKKGQNAEDLDARMQCNLDLSLKE